MVLVRMQIEGHRIVSTSKLKPAVGPLRGVSSSEMSLKRGKSTQGQAALHLLARDPRVQLVQRPAFEPTIERIMKTEESVCLCM